MAWRRSGGWLGPLLTSCGDRRYSTRAARTTKLWRLWRSRKLHPHDFFSTYPLQLSVQPSPEASCHGPDAALDAFEQCFWPAPSPRQNSEAAIWQPWYVTSAFDACGTSLRRCRWPHTSRFATKRRTQRARAGLSSMLLQRLPRGPRPARMQFRGYRKTHKLLCDRAKPLTLAGAANERSGGPADRPTPKKRRRSSRLAAPTADRRTGQRHGERCTHASREITRATACLTPRSPRSRRTRPSARSGRSRRRWPRTGPSPSGSACARATRSAGTRSGGTGAARSSACKLSA